MFMPESMGFPANLQQATFNIYVLDSLERDIKKIPQNWSYEYTGLSIYMLVACAAALLCVFFEK